jgi:hypothetical protein
MSHRDMPAWQRHHCHSKKGWLARSDKNEWGPMPGLPLVTMRCWRVANLPSTRARVARGGASLRFDGVGERCCCDLPTRRHTCFERVPARRERGPHHGTSGIYRFEREHGAASGNRLHCSLSLRLPYLQFTIEGKRERARKSGFHCSPSLHLVLVAWKPVAALTSP